MILNNFQDFVLLIKINENYIIYNLYIYILSRANPAESPSDSWSRNQDSFHRI